MARNIDSRIAWSTGQTAELDEQCRKVEPRFWRAARWSLVWLGLALPLPLLLADTGPAYLMVPVALAAAIVGIAATEPESSRRLVVSLGIIGFACSWTILLAVLWVQRGAGFVVLGPDGAEYLRGAEIIVATKFTLPKPSHLYFETFSTAHYFLFAAILYLLGPSLFHLQAFNCAAVALIGPLTFAWTREVYPRGALPAALLVTLFPSLAYLAALDLLKDPSVVLATTLVIWALVQLYRAQRAARLIAFGLLAGGCLWYLNTSRFYPAIYLELGLIFAAIVALVHRRPLRKGVLVAVVAAIAVGEAGPIARGWPGSPLLLTTSIAHVLNVPSMRYFTAGLMDRMARESPRSRETAGHKLETLGHLNTGLLVGSKSEQAGDRPAATTDRRAVAANKSPAAADRPQKVLRADVDTELATSMKFGSFAWMAHIIRRIYGPFVWILPPTMTAGGWLGGLYLMYPGMLFWYALVPPMAVGFGLAGWSILRGRQHFILGVVWVYAGLYSLQYLAINLSFRQREAVFPVLAVFGVMGYHWARGRRWATWLYVAYWIGLTAMAVVHLVVRARMVA